MTKLEYDRLTHMIRGAAIEVHKELGPGLLESVYEYCLVDELRKEGLKVEQQVMVPIIYKGRILEKHFFVDILVEDEIVIELKCVEEIRSIHEVQLVTYLKLSSNKLGLLINFNVPKMIDGIKRKVNGFPKY